MNSQITSPCFNGAPADPRHHAAGRRSFRSAQGWRRSLLAAATAVLLGAAAAQAAEPLPMLLGSPPTARVSTQAATTLMANRALASERQVAINFQYLDPQSGKAPAQLGVELFDGEVVTLERGRIEQRGPGNYTWLGHVQGSDRGDAVLTVINGQIAGTIVVVDSGLGTAHTYQLQSGPGGGQSLRRLDPSRFPQDHPPGHDSMAAPPAPAGTLAGGARAQAAGSTAVAAADSGGTIDVMIVYSNQTAAAAGLGIGAEIQQAVDRANLAYSNSGIATRLRLVHYQQVAYNESNDFNTDLNRLTTGNDGYMDEIPGLRDAYGADLVSLFVENGQYCGIGWLGPNAGSGFTVVNRGCAGGNLSFAHEVGHNIGARHDPYVDSSNNPYPYGHGYAYPAGSWRTVMAYNNACAAAGTSCTRIAYFSNPLMFYGTAAQPMGSTATSDNARLINENAYTVANFRQGAGGACTYTLSVASAAPGAEGGDSSFAVTAAAGCAWNAQTSALPWLAIGAGSGTSGTGSLLYSVAANAGPARSGSITVGDRTFTVNQATGCTYALNSTSTSVEASGGTGSVGLTTGNSCPWTAGSSATSWLTVSPASGTGSAAAYYAAAANTGAARSANLTMGGITFVVSQAAAPAMAALSATSISFASQKVGSTSGAKSVTLKNNGGGALTVTALTAGGANPGDFVRSGTCAVNTALAAGQSCTLQYRFKPAAKGSRAASLAVSINGGNLSLALSGTGR